MNRLNMIIDSMNWELAKLAYALEYACPKIEDKDMRIKEKERICGEIGKIVGEKWKWYVIRDYVRKGKKVRRE